MMRRWSLGLVAVLGATPGAARAQGLTMQAGHLFDAAGMSSYQLSWTTPALGVLAFDVGGVMWRGPSSAERRVGLVADASLFRGGRPGLYAVGGVGAGLGSGGAERNWTNWSAGLGYELIPLSFLSLGAEGRWRSFQPSGRAGIEFALRLGTSFGAASRMHGPAERAPEAADGPLLAPEHSEAVASATAAAMLADVIRTAEGQMGSRYRYGGTDGGGFDCSGLIQFAYGHAGISLPRRSTDQARIGVAVNRSESGLQPGDILTFAKSGRRITHVGLYIGDGRFIHSASGGVQVSVLRTDDPHGQWWYQRWIGVRRVVTPTP